jgi:hypothetical protein
LEICRHFKATEYFSGPFGRDYIDQQAFDEAGIKIVYHDYDHPVYPQYQGKNGNGEFVSHLSIVDLLFNCGPDARSYIK